MQSGTCRLWIHTSACFLLSGAAANHPLDGAGLFVCPLIAKDSMPRTMLLFVGRGMVRVSKGVLPVYGESLMLGDRERAKFIVTVEEKEPRQAAREQLLADINSMRFIEN